MLNKLLFTGLVFFLIVNFIYSGDRLFFAKKSSMAEVVQSAALSISGLCEDLEEEEDQLDIIRRFIEPVRFLNDKSGYFYVYNYDCVCVAHAIQKDIVNKNLFDYQDSNGKYVIRELSKMSKSGGGFVDFRWQKPDGTPDKQKLGYVAPIQGTNFFIGSGVYMPDNEFIIAFAYAKPPFVFAAPPFSFNDYDIFSAQSGIELEIMKEALKISGYSFTPVYYTYKNLEKGLKNGVIEIAATVRNNLPDIFYSDEFVYFQNVVVTKKKNNITIENLSDLKDKSIVTWEGAKKDLGVDFENSVINNINYKEIGNQEEQGAKFFNDEAEVIIIDKTIFEWWLLKFADKYNTSDEYIYHNLFPDQTKFYVGFKSKEICDIFDKGLAQIKANGLYNKIFSQYK